MSSDFCVMMGLFMSAEIVDELLGSARNFIEEFLYDRLSYASIKGHHAGVREVIGNLNRFIELKNNPEITQIVNDFFIFYGYRFKS